METYSSKIHSRWSQTELKVIYCTLFVSARLRVPQDGLFTGVINAVDTAQNSYRIQFDRNGLGSHLVPDYEVMVSTL